MLAAALALITSLCYGVSNFVGPTLSRGLPVYPVLIAGQLVAFGVSGAVLAATQPAGPDGTVLLAAAVAGIGNALGLICFYRAATLGPLSIVTPIGSLGVIVPVTAGARLRRAARRLQARRDRAGDQRRRDRLAPARGRCRCHGLRAGVRPLGPAVRARLRHLPGVHRPGLRGRRLLGGDAQPRLAAHGAGGNRARDRRAATGARCPGSRCSRCRASCCSPARSPTPPPPARATSAWSPCSARCSRSSPSASPSPAASA